MPDACLDGILEQEAGENLLQEQEERMMEAMHKKGQLSQLRMLSCSLLLP